MRKTALISSLKVLQNVEQKKIQFQEDESMFSYVHFSGFINVFKFKGYYD